MAFYNGVTSGLHLALDAADSSSYPGSGSTWYDISGNSRHFNINASAYNGSGAIKFMDFKGSYGLAKYAAGTTDVSGLAGNSVTYVLLTRPKNSTGEWRTLTRGWSDDHHVIIQDGGWQIGMFDNNAAGFLNTGYSQQSLPGYPNGFDVWIVRWSNNDSPVTFDLNVNGTQRGTFTNSNGRYNQSFYSLGAYHNGSSDVNSGSQWWGDISYFAVYNRRLTDAEVTQINNEYETGGTSGPRILISMPVSSVTENSGSSLVYQFFRANSGTPVTTGTDTVSFQVSGNATYNVDYTVSGANTFSASNGTITITNGVANVYLNITPIADSTTENTSNATFIGVETVVITPNNTTSGYSISTSPLTGLIYDDDISMGIIGGAGNTQLEISALPYSSNAGILNVGNISIVSVTTYNIQNTYRFDLFDSDLVEVIGANNSQTTIAIGTSEDSVNLGANLVYTIDFAALYTFDLESEPSDTPIQVWTD